MIDWTNVSFIASIIILVSLVSISSSKVAVVISTIVSVSVFVALLKLFM